MIKKLTKLTKALLVAAGLCVGATSAWADTTVGATDCSTALDATGSYSDSYTIKGDGSVHFTFVNHNNGGENWENWYLYCASNDKATDYFRLRADNCEDKTLSNTNCVSNFDWGNFVSDMNGATVDMYVSRLGSVVTVSSKITTTADKTYYYSYTYVNASMTAKITVWLGVRLSYLTISTAEPTTYTSAYSYDFNNSTHPFTYSADPAIGYPSSVNGGDGNLMQESTFSADRTMSLSYAGNATFTGATDYVYEFDWNASSSNANANTLTINGASGKLLTVSQAGNSKPAKTFTASSDLATHEYQATRHLGTPPAFYHFIISASSTKGVYLTVLYNKTTVVVANQRIADFTTIASVQDVCGKSYHHVIWDDLILKTAAPVGTVSTPTYTITGAAGTSRKFTLGCGTANTTIYYAASNLEKGADGWTEYTGEVTTAETTIYAYAVDEDDYTSSKMNFATGAGTTVGLATPSISATGFTNTTGMSVNNPTFNFSCNNSAVLGNPTATFSYTFTPYGGVESSVTAGSSYTPTGYGTLKVIASADGYDSSEKTLVVSCLYTVSYTGRDYTTATTTDIAGAASWGDEFNVAWDDWADGLKANLLKLTLSDDQRLNIRNGNTIYFVSGWGWVRNDNSYNYYSRYAKEGYFVGLKVNTSKGSDAEALTYPTSYCSGGTGINTDLVTINVPADNLVQQLYFYEATPTSVPVTIGAMDWTTFASKYALDLTNLPDGVKAYVAATGAVDTENNKITLTEKSDEAVAAGTGLMFKGIANTSYNIPVAATGKDISASNLLKGCATSTTITNQTANYANFYVLVNGKSAAEFQNLATYVASHDVTIAAGKAYLDATDATVSGGARSLKIVFGDETTGINTVQSAERSENCYNLAGQRVATPQKGLYIVSGKKVIIK